MRNSFKDLVRKLLKGHRGIPEAKRHPLEPEEPPRGVDTTFILVLFSNRHEMKGFSQINFREEFGLFYVALKSVDIW